MVIMMKKGFFYQFVLILLLYGILTNSVLSTVLAADEMGTDEEIYQGLNSLNLQIDESKMCGYKGIHPRILMDEKKLAEVKRDINEPGRMKEVADDLIKRADSALKSEPPKPEECTGTMPDAVSSNSTNTIPTLAMGVSADRKFGIS